MAAAIDFRVDPFPDSRQIDLLWREAWGHPAHPDYSTAVLPRSLGHVAAYTAPRLIGFVNLAWDGGVHAFILDTVVHPDFRRLGVATRMVTLVTDLARQRGAHWLHVDYEPHLEGFYAGCGFHPTSAGLIDLTS